MVIKRVGKGGKRCVKMRKYGQRKRWVGSKVVGGFEV